MFLLVCVTKFVLIYLENNKLHKVLLLAGGHYKANIPTRCYFFSLVLFDSC